MRRFKAVAGNAVNSDGGARKATLLLQQENDLALLADATPARLDKANRYLQNADRLLRKYKEDAGEGRYREVIDEMARKYFTKEFSAMNEADYSLVQSVIILISNGLSSDVSLKICRNISDSPDAQDAVRTRMMYPGMSVDIKPHYSDFEYLRTGN